MLENRTVDEACNIEYGTRVVRKNEKGNQYPVYGGGGPTFTIDRFNRSDRVVVSRFGMSPRCTRMVSGAFFLNDSGLTLSPKVRDLGARFLDYQILHLNDQIYALGKGSAQKNLDVTAFKSISLSQPSLARQEQVVAYLDSIFENTALAIAVVQNSIKRTRELFESARESFLTPTSDDWDRWALSDIIDIKHGFAFKSPFFRSSGSYVLLTPGNFFEKGGFKDRGDKQKYYVGELPDGYILDEGDLLVAMTEQAPGLLGSPAIVPKSKTFLHNQRLGLVTVKGHANVQLPFLFHIFNLARVRKEIHDSAAGVKVRHTSPSKIGAVFVWTPRSSELQSAIVERLDRVHAETAQMEQLYVDKLGAISDLKRSALSAAFDGKM